MIKVYPVFFKKNDTSYLVYIPDFNQYTEGGSFAEAFSMARDAMGTYSLAVSREQLPAPSNYESALAITKENADDEDFLFSDGVFSFVDIDFDEYARKLKNRSVRKNCTIPYELNEKAEGLGMNFSKILQEALEEKIHQII